MTISRCSSELCHGACDESGSSNSIRASGGSCGGRFSGHEERLIRAKKIG